MRDELDALISQMHKGGILYTKAVREFRKAFIATVLRECERGRTTCTVLLQLPSVERANVWNWWQCSY